MKLENNKNILCTVSAGYSSIMMAVKLREWYPDHNIVFVMANTSKERKESLDFMHKCDKYFRLNMVWLEAVINQEKGVGTIYKVTNFKNLKRNGEIFEDGIKKYGIPCKINKWCNREMKIVPIKKFADSFFSREVNVIPSILIGDIVRGKINYSIAVGMRTDEMDRIKKDYKTNNTFYPLIDNGISNKERNLFWSKQPIKISIPAYKGNCDLCFAKSNRKLTTIIKEEPNVADWWGEMIEKYSKISIEGKPSYNIYAENGGMNFFRENRSLEDLVKLAQRPFSKATDEYIYESDLFDLEDECGSGCQVF